MQVTTGSSCQTGEKAQVRIRPMSKQQFCAKVAKFCLAHGATVKEPKTEYSQACYLLATPYGDLTVRALGDWVACRFLDGERAKPVTRQSFVANGKWNFLGYPNQREVTYLAFESSLLRVLNETKGGLQ